MGRGSKIVSQDLVKHVFQNCTGERFSVAKVAAAMNLSPQGVARKVESLRALSVKAADGTWKTKTTKPLTDDERAEYAFLPKADIGFGNADTSLSDTAALIRQYRSAAQAVIDTPTDANALALLETGLVANSAVKAKANRK